MSNATGGVSEDPIEPFDKDAVRPKWGLLTTVLTLYLTAFAIIVLILHVAGYFFGHVLFFVLVKMAPVFMAHVYPGEMMGGENFFSLPIIMLTYIIGSFAIQIGPLFYMAIYGEESALARAVGFNTLGETVVWLFLILGFVVPLLAGLATGFW